MLDTCTPRDSATNDATPTQSLPPCVARYFAFALPPNVLRIARAHIEWSGTMTLKRDARSLKFSAQQEIVTRPPSFVWDATMKAFAGVRIRVRDSYDAGRGATRARLAGIISLVDQPGTAQTAEAALQRFLGEAIWFPTALLPSAGVVWTSRSADRATATFTDHGNGASIDFCFGALGEIIGCSALRYRDVGDHSVRTPWRTRTWDYETVDGMMIPRSGEATWILPDGALTYWRGVVENVWYEYDSE